MSTTGIPILDLIRKIQATRQSGTTPITPPVNTPSGNNPVTTPVQIPKPSKSDVDDLFLTGID